jgi:hypothetical protein
MSRFVKVSDKDYKLSVDTGSVGPNGTITLDTGNQVGTVVITGNLLVQGETTTTETTELKIEDRIITLNFGDAGPGITHSSGQAGIEINRGPGQDLASILFNDNSALDDFSFRLGPTLTSIKTSGITTNGLNLQLLDFTTNATLSVAGAPDYEERILNYVDNPEYVDDIATPEEEPRTLLNLSYKDPDHIPNIKAVADYTNKFFELTPPFKIQDSAVINDITVLYDSLLEIHDASADGGVSNLELQLDGFLNAIWYPDRHEVQNIRIADTTIQTLVSNTDLILRSDGAGSVTVDDTLKLTLVSADPNPTSIEPDVGGPFGPDGIKIYAKSQAQGGTGVYFVNTQDTRDEFASRRKSLVYSMIF